MASFEITSNESENNKHLEQCLVELNQNIDNIESLFDKNEKIKISDIFQFLHRLTQRRNDSYCDIFAKYKFEIFLTKLYQYFGP
jgi:hypothetical protein